MKIRLFISLLLLSAALRAQDTFSIVAVDSLTGEIGSAGASCLDDIQFPGSNGAIIISDIIPGRGAIHTQAQWSAVNQANAHARMLEGLSPQEITAWLKTNDVGGAFGYVYRQYGVVDFDSLGHPRSSGFTGSACYDWKGHITGVNYAIQGNILLGPEILDSMEMRFLNTPGTLADRLMAALQGAKVPGADTRCLNNGTSSLSAFIRVAKPADDPDSVYLHLNVPSLPAGQEPIDSLQTLYSAWKTTATYSPSFSEIKIFPNPASGRFTVMSPEPGVLEIIDAQGRLQFRQSIPTGETQFNTGSRSGLYLVRFTGSEKSVLLKKMVWY